VLVLPQEDIIYSVVGDAEFDNMPDFIVSEDVTGVNAGTFLFPSSFFCKIARTLETLQLPSGCLQAC
jgi:hypothetical protein